MSVGRGLGGAVDTFVNKICHSSPCKHSFSIEFSQHWLAVRTVYMDSSICNGRQRKLMSSECMQLKCYLNSSVIVSNILFLGTSTLDSLQLSPRTQWWTLNIEYKREARIELAVGMIPTDCSDKVRARCEIVVEEMVLVHPVAETMQQRSPFPLNCRKKQSANSCIHSSV